MDDDQEMTQYYDGGTQFDEPDEPQENDSTLGGGGRRSTLARLN